MVLFTQSARAFDVHDGALFAEGFAMGIIATIPRNITKCRGDFPEMFGLFAAGFEELEHGFDISFQHALSGLQDIGRGIEKTGTMLVDCGIIDASLHIASIGESIKEGECFSLDIVEEVVFEIIHKDHPITTHFKEAIKNWNEGNYYDSGKAIGEIVALIIAGNTPSQYALLYLEAFEALSKLFDLTKKGAETVVDWGKETAGKVADVATDAVDQAGKVANKVADGAKEAVNQAGNVMDKVGDGAKEAANQVGNVASKVGDGAKEAANQVGNVAGKVGDGAKEAVDKVGGWVGKLF